MRYYVNSCVSAVVPPLPVEKGFIRWTATFSGDKSQYCAFLTNSGTFLALSCFAGHITVAWVGHMLLFCLCKRTRTHKLQHFPTHLPA